MRSSRSASALVALGALTAALLLSGCGNKTASLHGGETEGIYLDVGPMKYQVQISRQLNPRAIPEDRQFVQGLQAADARLAPDELWFAVFVRVENPTGRPQAPAGDYEISDTEGHRYRPVAIGRANPFAYTSDPVPPKSVMPDPDSVAAQTSIAGGELLFKLKRGTLDNRPLELTIRSAFPADESHVTLDV